MNLNISHAMFPTYMLFGVSLFYLVFTVWNYKRTMATGGTFAYKPLMLLFMIMAFGITDEIFGISVCNDGKLNPFYIYGAMSVAMPGWILGTFLGVISGDILPLGIISTLSVALYAMFIAVIILSRLSFIITMSDASIAESVPR